MCVISYIITIFTAELVLFDHIAMVFTAVLVLFDHIVMFLYCRVSVILSYCNGFHC